MVAASPKHFRHPAPVLTRSQLSLSTLELYEEHNPPCPSDLNHPSNHFGPYARERTGLDYHYHKLPTRSRQELQDSIVHVALNVPQKCKTCDKSKDDDERPTALFTAGGMGSGKSHTLKVLMEQGVVKLPCDFVWVDPDRLARKFPERPQYLKADPEKASTLLHPEASMLQEILAAKAKHARRSLVIDGSLADSQWFTQTMRTYDDAGYNIEILFVYAAEDTMICRANKRAQETGRYTDPEHIKRSRRESPKSVQALAVSSLIHRVRLVSNWSDDSPAEVTYDSDKDPNWVKGGQVPVMDYIEGRNAGQARL